MSNISYNNSSGSNSNGKKSSSSNNPYFLNQKFTFIEKIGRGSFGEVWKVKDNETYEIVAIKELDLEGVFFFFNFIYIYHI